MKEGLKINIPVQSPVVLVFESDRDNLIPFKGVSEKRIGILEKIKEMRQPKRLVQGKPSVLFIKPKIYPNRVEIGKAASPIVVDLLEKNGCEVYERFPYELDYQTLKEFDVLFIIEDYQFMWKMIAKNNKKLFEIIRRYIKNGGGLFVCGTPNVGPNATSQALNSILNKYGIKTLKKWNSEKPVWFMNPEECLYKDPLQVIFTDIRAHPVTEDVKSFYSYCSTPIVDTEDILTPIIFSSENDINFPSTPVMYAGEIGEGRVVVSGDTYFMQPFRIEDGDNLKLIWNIFSWLSKGKIENLPKDELENKLFFTEKEIEDIEQEEGF